MSLTMQVKRELAGTEPPFSCCSSWELKALLLRHGYYTLRRDLHIISIAAEHSVVARRLFGLLRQAGVSSPSIVREQEKRLGRTRFLVQVTGTEQADALLVYLDLKEAGPYLSLPRRHTGAPRRDCCRKAFLRGAFLAGGSISISRRSGYHLEINCGSMEDAGVYRAILGAYGLNPLVRNRKGGVFLCLKSAEAVADCLRIAGAGSALLDLESRRVVSSMRNRVNRLVNCETANLDKTVASAQQQLETIDRVERRYGLENLPPSLREAAGLRRQHEDASLKELGEMLDPPISKPAMSHRFRRLEKLLD